MKICCIKTSFVPKEIKSVTDVFTVQYADFIGNNDIDWIERSEAETDKDFQQIIPYVLVKNFPAVSEATSMKQIRLILLMLHLQTECAESFVRNLKILTGPR